MEVIQRTRITERIARNRITLCRYCGNKCKDGGTGVCALCREILIRRITKGMKQDNG